jgi:hypothetical protein
MYKIIDLGAYVEDTLEPRVSIVDDGYLVKTASNDIQVFWRTFNRGKNKGYLHVIAMTDGNYYGPNNNGDWFDGADLKKYHPSFVKDGHIFLFHMNKDVNKSIGKPIYSFYNDNMHRVELVLEFDKGARGADVLVSKLRNNEQVFVSMGVRVANDVCSICGHKSKTRAEYCDHLKYNMKKILADGRQVYAINPGPLRFFDISIVNRPADKTAWALEKEASDKKYTNARTNEYMGDTRDAKGESVNDGIVKTSAELGEEHEYALSKISSIKKVSDIIKQVDGNIADIDVGDDLDEKRKLEFLKSHSQQLDAMDYPTMDFDDLDATDVSPGGLIRITIGLGGVPSVGDMAYSAGKHFFGDSLTQDIIPQILDKLQEGFSFLQDRPDKLESTVLPILNDVDPEEIQNGSRFNNIVHTIGPVVKNRIILIKRLLPSNVGFSDDFTDSLTKSAANSVINYGKIPEFNTSDSIDVNNLMNNKSLMKTLKYSLNEALKSSSGNLDTVKFIDRMGNAAVTNRYNVTQATSIKSPMEIIKRILGSAIGLAGLLSLFSNRPLLERVLTSVLGVGVGSVLLNSKPVDELVETEHHTEIPAASFGFHHNKTAAESAVDWKNRLKKFTDSSKEIGSFTKENLPVLLGLSVPSVLGLDYLINKKWIYRNYRDPEQEMSLPGRLGYKAGRMVVNNPVTTYTGSVLLGSLLNEKLRNRK